MAEERRSSLTNDSGKIDTSVMMAKVVGYLDPTFMGGLEVSLLRDQNNTAGDTHQTYSVKYAPPFYGVTGFEYMGLNKDDFNDTQKSYGMWFPTPEIGTTVLVVFINGDPAEGYYIGSIPSRFANQMIPGIAASPAVEWAEGAKEKYDVESVPVAEVNRKTNEQQNGLDFNKLKKPVHPFADRLLEEGLLEDSVRGTTTATGRRNLPNSVFGISTPGPFDRTNEAKKGYIGKKQARTDAPIPVSRLGGSQFVMDDGDERFQRKSKPSEGPPEYADVLNKEKGEPDLPKDEFIRLRTRTGHQILLHNSEDLVYIANSRGTSWIEMTSDGKIDIYAEDSVSVHTKTDFNFRADRDVNIEAGRNINMKTVKGKLHADVNGNLEFVVANNTLITTLNNLHVRTTGKTSMSSGQGLDVSTVGVSRMSSTGEIDLASNGAIIVDAGGTTSIKGADVIVQGIGEIHLNGPAALTADIAAEAESAQTLSLHKNIVTNSAAEWGNKNRYRESFYLNSIMKRVPMHEPWTGHENLDPIAFKPDKTDRDPSTSTSEPSGGTNGTGINGTGTGGTGTGGTGTGGTGTGTENDGSLPEESASTNSGSSKEALQRELNSLEERLAALENGNKTALGFRDQNQQRLDEAKRNLESAKALGDPDIIRRAENSVNNTQTQLVDPLLRRISQLQSEINVVKQNIAKLRAEIAAKK
jgi:hypothetical protein